MSMANTVNYRHGQQRKPLIIDSDSCKNVVSTYVLEKLQLKIEKHHTPNKLKWLNEDNKVIMEMVSLNILFFIGKKYFHIVWCAMVAMNVCHVLLGKHWQYDKNVMYNRRRNAYTLNIKKMYNIGTYKGERNC